jgi:uncharacterized protein YaiI (UPF0178 family)
MSDVLFRHRKALGKLADLVLADANPLADIADARRVRAVVANGRLYRRRDLERLLTRADSFRHRRQVHLRIVRRELMRQAEWRRVSRAK